MSDTSLAAHVPSPASTGEDEFFAVLVEEVADVILSSDHATAQAGQVGLSPAPPNITTLHPPACQSLSGR